MANAQPTPAPEPGKPEPERRGGSQALSLVATVVAILLIVAYLAFLALQWNDAEAADLSWARRSDLLGGLEALAFAAAGAILGTTVQRQVTQKAEERATEARREAEEEKERADQNARDAEKGRALHRLAMVKTGRQPSGPAEGGPGVQRGPPTAAPAPTGYEEFVALAESYGRSP